MGAAVHLYTRMWSLVRPDRIGLPGVVIGNVYLTIHVLLIHRVCSVLKRSFFLLFIQERVKTRLKLHPNTTVKSF